MKSISFKTKSLGAVFLIAVISLAVYANTLDNSFLGDDTGVIEQCPFIRSWQNFPVLFTSNYPYLSKESTYRPVVTFSYMIDYSLWGLNPFGFHLTNIILHALNGILLYLLIIKLFPKKIGLALSCALLFVTHPITTEAVNLPSFREDLLVLNFSLLSFLAYSKTFFKQNNKVSHFFLTLCLIFMFFALFSKESAFSLPFVFFISDVCFNKEKLKTIKNKAPVYCTFIFSLGLYSLIRFYLIPTINTPSFKTSILYFRMLTQSKIIIFYIKLLFLPIKLCPHYVYILSKSFWDPAIICSIFMLLTIIIFSIYVFRRNSGFTFSIWWFFLFLLPVSNIIPIFVPVVERFLYVPSIGFCLGIALIGEIFFIRLKNRSKYIPLIFLVILLSFYSYRTIIRNNDWKNSLTLWSKAVQSSPDNPAAHNSLGVAYNDIGKTREAIVLYEKSLKIISRTRLKYLFERARIYNNLGVGYYNTGETNKAISYYKKALELDSGYEDIYNNLGAAYYSIGKKEKTKDLLEKAIKIKPDFAKPYNNLGILYNDLGKIDKAITCYKKALELDPNYITPLNGLSSIYYNTNRNKEALTMLEKTLEIDPGNKKAHILLAMTYYRTKQYDLAIRYCDKAVNLGYNVERDFLKSLQPYRKH